MTVQQITDPAAAILWINLGMHHHQHFESFIQADGGLRFVDHAVSPSTEAGGAGHSQRTPRTWIAVSEQHTSGRSIGATVPTTAGGAGGAGRGGSARGVQTSAPPLGFQTPVSGT